MRRRFNDSERVALYIAAGGCCQQCGAELGPGWHADHVKPWSEAGPTGIENGQALCPDCNLRKGNRLTDRIELRRFQRELHLATAANIERGVSKTVADVAPGSGKTLAGLNVANDLYRDGLIDGLAWFTPRVILASQLETDWAELCDPAEEPYYADPRMGEIRHNTNSPPLTPNPVFGYAATYQALTTGRTSACHPDWAREHQGRFLLVCDEAQFLGTDGDDRGGGTQAGQWIQRIAALAKHTILLTGTPYRSDGCELVLAEYSPPNAQGYRELKCDVTATYREGVADGYLRPFQFNLVDGVTRWRDYSDHNGRADSRRISELDARIGQVVRDPRVYRRLVDDVVQRLRERRQLDRRYTALISCSKQQHAAAVHRYLRAQHSDLRTLVAKSEDSDAKSYLQDFKNGEADVLVTVDMAYIGFDYKPITVVGILHDKRWHGYLHQLVARGMRVWRERPLEEQTVFVVAPDDPQMAQFCEALRQDSSAGLKERARRDVERNGSSDPAVVRLEEAELTVERALGLDASADAETYALFRRLKEKHRLADAETKLLAAFEDLNEHAPSQREAPPVMTTAKRPRVTFQQHRKDVLSIANDLINSYVANGLGIRPGEDSYKDAVTQVRMAVNARAGISSVKELVTWDGCDGYIAICRDLFDRA